MDPLGSPRLGRRARYDSFHSPLHFSDPNPNLHRHPPSVFFRPHPAIPRDHYHDSRPVYPIGDFSYIHSLHRTNHSGLDTRPFPFQRVPDRAIHHGLSGVNSLLPEPWERGQDGGVTIDVPGVFDGRSDLFRPCDDLLKIEGSDPSVVARRRLVSEKEHFLGENSEWNNRHHFRLWDERPSRYHNRFLAQLQPEIAPLETVSLFFPPPVGIHGAGSVKIGGGEPSSDLNYESPLRLPFTSCRFSPDVNVIKSTAAQIFGNEPLSKRLQSPKKNNDCNFGRRQYVGHKAIKKFDPVNPGHKVIKKSDSINVTKEVDFWSSRHMVRKTSSILATDYEHGFGEGCSTSYNGKRKMLNSRSAKYNTHLENQSMQKPIAFLKKQSGLSVWDRLEEKPLIFPPHSSSSCQLSSSPRISNETEFNSENVNLSFKSNLLVAKIVDPSIVEPSSIENDVIVEKLNTALKKKNMNRMREKVIIPIVSSSLGSSAEHNKIRKKKKKKTLQLREKVVIPIIPSSSDTSANQSIKKNSDVSNIGNASVLADAKNEIVLSFTPGSKSLSNAGVKKAKELVAAKMIGVKEDAEVFSLVEGCIIETPRMNDDTEYSKYESGVDCAKEMNNCTHIGDTENEPIVIIDDSSLQMCQKFQMLHETPANDVSASIITKDSQTQGIVIEILDDSGEEEQLEPVKKLDNKCKSLLDSDVNVTSMPHECIIDNVVAQDSTVDMYGTDFADSSKQIKSELNVLVNSLSWKFGQYMSQSDDAASAELLSSGEVFVSACSKTHCSDNSLKCNSTEIGIETEEVKHHREKVLLITATEEVVPGDGTSSQSGIQGIRTPLFSETSNAPLNLGLPSDGTVQESIMPLLSGCNNTIRDTLDTLTIDPSRKATEHTLLLGPTRKVCPALHLENLSHSPEVSESMDFCSNADDSNTIQEHICNGEASVSTMKSSAVKSGFKLGKLIKSHQFLSNKSDILPANEPKKQVPPNPKIADAELSCDKNVRHANVSRSISRRLNYSSLLKVASRTGQTGRHRTWLRTNAPSLHSLDEVPKPGGFLSEQTTKKPEKIQNTSYFRKGNSLIRKLAAEPPPVLLQTVGASSRKVKFIAESSVKESRSECQDNAAPSHPLLERPDTLPLPPLSNYPGVTMNSHKDCPQLLPADRSLEPGTDQGNQHDNQSRGLFSGNLESQDSASRKTVESVNEKKVTIVKHKVNQLVAAPGPENGDSSKLFTEKIKFSALNSSERSKIVPVSSSYLYYRSKRNQLIRNATPSNSKLTGIPDSKTDSVDSLQNRKTNFSKKRLDNVLHKAKKLARSSRVWTLCGNKLSQSSLGFQSIFPYILLWKRAVYWKSFIKTGNNPISRSSSSWISRKLKSLKKRDTIYKVSTNGFSLRKAGVVSIGGSSLKWSKSIEKHSKKANEEATLAVAEVERKKRERKRSKSTCGDGRNKVGLSCKSIAGVELKQGESIFRVGSARYKMESSKRTLIRIPDDLTSSFASQQPGNKNRLSFEPKRVLIGNHEYVQIGNGNQLVRDPKKFKLILANEKVRWSLHTARLRLAQKRQYCLFFARFGKCNGRNCPYIHDVTKVAICRKFLKDQCFDVKCKLTHKFIPERMPDCSYFLKGLCTNLNCPYRHVKVNSTAALCDGFLRGHCTDADKCCKKHSYTCPLFEATGKCPQGYLCKLHHPKTRSKTRKRKRTKIQNSSPQRYFYSSIDKGTEPLRVSSSLSDLKDGNDIFCSDGRFTEYISLDVESDDDGMKNALMDSYLGKWNPGYLDIQSCDANVHIKPIRIMNRDDLTIL